MLSADEIHKFATERLTSVKWDGADCAEWNFVGDGSSFHGEALLHAVREHISSEGVYAVMNSTFSRNCSPKDAVEFVRKNMTSGQILICDHTFTKYIEVSAIGVFRRGLAYATAVGEDSAVPDSFWFDICAICGQGRLFLCLDTTNDRMFLNCEECSASLADPSGIKNSDKYILSDDADSHEWKAADLKEIASHGWVAYATNAGKW